MKYNSKDGPGMRVTRSRNLTRQEATDKRPRNTDDVAGENQTSPPPTKKKDYVCGEGKSATSTGRGRGRPPKKSDKGKSETSTGRGRGRPPKARDTCFVVKLPLNEPDEKSVPVKAVAEDIGQPQKNLSPSADENITSPIDLGKGSCSQFLNKIPYSIRVLSPYIQALNVFINL